MEKHPGFKKAAASIASKQGVSKESASAILAAGAHKASAAAKAKNPRLNRVMGKKHDGGQITEDGLYEMQKGEVVIPAGMGQGKVSNVREARSNVMNHHENVEAFPNTDGSMEHSGHWEIDGNSSKFVAGATAKSTAGHHSDPPEPAGAMPGKHGYNYNTTGRKSPKVEMGKGMKKVEPGDPGTGRYSDRIKIAPKYGAPEQPPLPKDSEIQKIMRDQETKA